MTKKITPTHVTVSEAAEMSGLSHWAWRRYVKLRMVDYSRVGNRLFIPVTEVHRILQENTVYRKKDPAKFG